MNQTPPIHLRRTALATLLLLTTHAAVGAPLKLNDAGYFTTPGLDVLAFSNTYDGNFSDSKIAGVELIHHGVRTATNGDVRLSPTPEQWDIVATPVDRKVDAASGTVTTRMRFDSENFEYAVKVSPRGDGVAIQVLLDKPLPASLAGKAGFNFEFLPSAYFGKSWMTDAGNGALPLYPSGPSKRDGSGGTVRLPLATGHVLTLAPEDATRRVAIHSPKAELSLYDGRNNAQNGWYVVRSLLPAGKTGARLIESGSEDEFLTRALRRAINQDTARLEYGHTMLASIASSAPFVGLFGTVWGIYHALVNIGMSGSGSLDQVAGPVGEALIMTALGLAVAIPAVLAYNFFNRAKRQMLSEVDGFAHDLFAFMSTGVRNNTRVDNDVPRVDVAPAVRSA